MKPPKLIIERGGDGVCDVYATSSTLKTWMGFLNHTRLAEYGLDIRPWTRVEIKIEVVEDKK